MKEYTSGHRFGSRSKEILETCHIDLKLIHNTAISQCPVDYGLHAGERTIEEQQKYFDEGASRINPKSYPSEEDLAKVAKHITIPGHPDYDKSRATDHHISTKYGDKPLTWNEIHLAFTAGYLIRVSHELYSSGKVKHILRWGGDWDSDGVIGLDQTLQDMPHLELIKVE